MKNPFVRLCTFFVIFAMSATLTARAEGEKAAGGYVTDPAVSVPADAYVTFSTVYNGKRYYLGVDTVAAKAGTPKDTVAWYDGPNYATMWIAGPLWSPTGAVLANKDYTRTIKSVWLDERVDRDRFLASGAPKSGYSPLQLVASDDPKLTMWHTAKDVSAQGQYIHGFLYAYSDEMGVEVYRYLTYDPIYGFSRLYESRPAVSQRISVWDRTRGNDGNDVTSTMTPPTWTFGLNTTPDTVRRHITSRVSYYTNIDRFRSRFDRVDVIVRAPDVYDDQYGLTQPPYEMFGYYEWASNPRPSLPETPDELVAQRYNGRAKMPFYADSINHHNSANEADWTIDRYWVDSTVLWVSDTKYKRDDEAKLWHDTIFSIGKSPFDVLRKPADGSAPAEGDYVDHKDWLRQHFFIKNSSGVYEHFVDSILVVRQTFHTEHITTLTTNASPADHVFPYFYDNKDKDGVAIGDRNTQLFTVSGTYRVDNDTLYADGGIVNSGLGDILDLDIRNATGTIVDEVKYDQLDVVAYEAGTTTPCSWLTVNVNPSRKDQIVVQCHNYNEAAQNNRVAEIHYTYRYSDGNVESTRVIWVTQRSKTVEEASSSAELYAFNHKGELAGGLQATHERKDILYAIPEVNLSLPVHRDHWGYYRWFIYDGDYKDKDLENNSTWTFARKPYNYRNQEFMPINHTTDPASRGQWDVIRDIHSGNDYFEPAAKNEHFVVGSATGLPSVKYPGATGDSKTGKIACDVSAYYDIATATTEGTPYVKKNLTSLTEPTLSYRQVFDVQPAKGRADELKTCLFKGDGAGKNDKWLEQKTVLVPTNSVFSLIPNYPVRKGDARFKDENLSYVYYANPTAAKEGTDEGFASADYKRSQSYNRVGVRKEIGDTYTLTPITVSQMLSMEGKNITYDSLLLVNPYTGECTMYGNNGGQIPARRGLGAFSSETVLRDSLKARIDRGDILLSTYLLDIGHYYYDHWLSSDENYWYISYNGTPLRNLFTLVSGLDSWWYYSLKWYGGGTGSNELNIAAYAGSSANLLTGVDGYLMTIYSTYGSNKGYYKAEEKTIRSYKFPLYPDDIAAASTTAKHAWLVYKVTKETTSAIHEEHPLWEKYNKSTAKWDSVAWVGGGKGDYVMLEGGELRVSKETHKTPNDTILYRLRTEHFQLAKFAVATRNDTVVGPSTTAIITEDSIQNHFDVLFTLGNEYFPAPGTTDVKAFYHHLPWNYTEMSYHYPVGDEPEKGEIPASKRVFTSDLPAAGEYAYLNKFTLDEHTTAAMAGAENGYMLCIHAAPKPMTIFDFTYPQLPCSDQDIYLTFDICNPLDNAYNPQVTADLEGKVGDGEWEPLYRFKTGGVLYKGGAWQQVVLHIPYASIATKDSFRFVAQLTGSTEQDAYVLIDRLRFIAKERPVSVFQNKGTCLADEAEGNVHIVARLDYKNVGYPAGTMVAYQYQKKEGSSYRPLLTLAEATAAGVPSTKDIDAYIDDIPDESSHTDRNSKSCGVVIIPAASHVPNSDSIVAVDAVTTKNKCYVNEGPDAEHAHYVMYISQQVHAQVGDTFRVVMAIIENKETHPNLSTEISCAAERVITIDNPIDIHVSGYTGAWPNHTRAELRSKTADPTNPTPEYTLRDANATYSATAVIADKFLPSGKREGSGKCMFDVVRTIEAERGLPSSNDAWFKKRFGCERSWFREIMMAFRKDVPENKMRLETNWNNITSDMFTYDGRSQAQADSMYAILNRLIVDSAIIEIGVSSYDVYLGDNNNAYAVFWPIPASGTYVDETSGETRSIPVCSTPRWFEIHSDAAAYSLRYGWDNMWAGDYYLIPVVRASSTDANTSLPVRISEITNDGSHVAVLGYDATTIVETNEPTWNAAVPAKTFRYHHDKDVRGVALTNTNNYYYKGGTAGKDTIVTFTPLAGNNYTLKAGYWYKFRTPYYAAMVGSDFYESTPVGYAEFIVAVAPDTVRWTPSHAGKANYWNDDHNWIPVMKHVPADGFKATVPMGDTKVIIPATAEGLLPIVSDVVENQMDTLHYGYKKNTCQKILFKPRSQILGQEKLTYQTAYIDVHLTTGNWQTFSPALEHIYSGDMYIPFAKSYRPGKGNEATGASIDTVDFAPQAFPYGTGYSGGYNPRVYPFAFYQGFYNSSVPVAFYNTDEDGEVDTNNHASKSVVDWVKTNVLDQEYVPGSTCIIKGYDAYDEDGRDIVVRLPKPSNTYYAYGKSGGSYISGNPVTITRTESASLTHNLAYDKTSLGESDGITYTLHNEIESNIFFFGNPTMSLVDVYQLCLDNAGVLQQADGKHQFTAYYLMDTENSNYIVKKIDGPGQFFIAPQRAVGLIANATQTAAKTLPIKLTPRALVAITGDGMKVSDEGISSMPRRVFREEAINRKRLYISAMNETNKGLLKAYVTLGEELGASRGYNQDEDAMSLSSGSHYYNSGSFATPLSMYTIAGNEALMMDIRDTLTNVPLVFATLDSVTNDKGIKVWSKYQFDAYTILSFSMDGNWDKALYLYDAVSGDSLLIRNGLQVAVRTPECDQLRYFINGGKRIASNDDEQGTTTGIENNGVVNGDASLISGKTVIYDVLGRQVMVLGEYDLIQNVKLPVGVYILQRGNTAEKMVIK